MLYKYVKQYKQLTVFNDPQKYDIVHWHTGGDGQIDRIGIKNYHPEQNITWVKIEYVNLIEPDTKLQKQDPNMSNKFNIEDRVILTGDLTPFPEWPVWGSEHSCAGTITNIEGGLVWVSWDNGTYNVLPSHNLSYFDAREESSLTPNLAFLKYKRKRNEKNKKRR